MKEIKRPPNTNWSFVVHVLSVIKDLDTGSPSGLPASSAGDRGGGGERRTANYYYPRNDKCDTRQLFVFFFALSTQWEPPREDLIAKTIDCNPVMSSVRLSVCQSVCLRVRVRVRVCVSECVRPYVIWSVYVRGMERLLSIHCPSEWCITTPIG